jgi:hypothetical protein
MIISLPANMNLPILFADLLANPLSIANCLPNVAETLALDNDTLLVRMKPIAVTPLYTCEPVGIFDIEIVGNKIKWHRPSVKDSRCNGYIEGEAWANADGTTHIEAIVTVEDNTLPQMWTPVITSYANVIAKKLVAEFLANWESEHAGS